jgi:hypothetical protein
LTQVAMTEPLINSNDGMTVKMAIPSFLWSEHSRALARPPASPLIFFSLLSTKRSVTSVIRCKIPCENGPGMHDGGFEFHRHCSVIPVTLI